MFRWLLKPRFYSKCLSYVKALKIRLERIQNRKKAVLKFLKSDIAELLRLGLEYDAYTRANGLLLEQKMLSCYELVENFVGCILPHVEYLAKYNDCPDECKEAVPSLIYAAARFGDLPELLELRTLFTEKYGNSLEPYINKEGKPGEDFNGSKEKERVGRKDLNDDSWIHQSSSSDDETSLSSNDGRKGTGSSSLGSISEDEVEKAETNRPISSFWRIPPPYIKQKTNKSDSKKTTHSDTATTPDSGGMNSDRKKRYSSQQPEHDTEQTRRRRSPHVRGKSLPSEPNTAVETSKGHIRTISLESGMRGGARHVHPNLPDYDDLRVRLLALRQR
ncbi:uncharacterized protein LOC108320492 isoform X2 [Vigna angularis]|uniref:uncharacterized protein LOC108320492 isoform X2 n=1 Tax=Phaseolus angularis TaxID=3914 RepID=UPI00080A78DD|nr:uncharacterized protein LOC108320492 isoform X2 [Vigna angularis]